MEVLEHGWVYDEKHNIVKCDCECRYKYDKEDVKSIPQIMWGHDCELFYFIAKYVECPECSEKYWFDEITDISKEEYESLKGCE